MLLVRRPPTTMSRRPAVIYRCNSCMMHQSLCICALVPKLVTRTRLVLLLHRAEQRKSTNTGQLAAACLHNAHIIVRGDRDQVEAPLPIADGSTPLLLFPAADAEPLEQVARRLAGPVTLLVPDGNWRQAGKMRKRVPGLADLPCVTLPARIPGNYRLRRATHDDDMATLEAIARAFELLEGAAGPALCEAMLRPFHAMVDRTLWSRGRLDATRVRGGIPEGAEPHDPRSGVLAAGALALAEG